MCKVPKAMATNDLAPEWLGHVKVIQAKGRSVEGRNGLKTQLREAKERSLPEEKIVAFLKASGDLPPDAKVILLDQISKIPDREHNGKIRVKYVSRDGEGHHTLDGSIPKDYYVLAEPEPVWKSNRWGR